MNETSDGSLIFKYAYDGTAAIFNKGDYKNTSQKNTMEESVTEHFGFNNIYLLVEFTIYNNFPKYK